MKHSEILRREFDRIASITDTAYFEMMHPDAPARAAGNYASWAALLLRYHDAIERVSGDEPDAPPVSMKGQPDTEPVSMKERAEETASRLTEARKAVPDVDEE